MAKLSKEHRAGAAAAADALIDAFQWDETPEGYDYWVAIHDRLTQLGEDGKMHRKQYQKD